MLAVILHTCKNGGGWCVFGILLVGSMIVWQRTVSNALALQACKQALEGACRARVSIDVT
jgi:hypothetical protein